jgi:hypothetical protein
VIFLPFFLSFPRNLRRNLCVSAFFFVEHKSAACFRATNAALFARFIRKRPQNSVFPGFEDVVFELNSIRKREGHHGEGSGKGSGQSGCKG